MDAASKYAVDGKEEVEEDGDVLAPLVNDGHKKEWKPAKNRIKSRSSVLKLMSQKELLRTNSMGVKKMRKDSCIVLSERQNLRQSIALFSKDSFMIKPTDEIQEQTEESALINRANSRGADRTIGALSQVDVSKLKNLADSRSSIFTRIEMEKVQQLEKVNPCCRVLLQWWYSYFMFWEYYTIMTGIYVAAMWTVFNPFSKDICGPTFPCLPGQGPGLKNHIPFYRAIFLLIAKWTAAALYVLMAECILIYSRVLIGMMQMTALFQYIPYIKGGGYHAAHQKRGWWFVTLAVVHTGCHILRVILKADMPPQLWVSGCTLFLSVMMISILAMRDFNIPCLDKSKRWAKSYLRKTVKWENMRAMHITGVMGMMVSAWWHRFPEGDGPMLDTAKPNFFPNRFFTLFCCFSVYYCLQRWINWCFTKQIDIVAHTIYKSCQLIVIKDFPYAKHYCNHGRNWFSADAKVMFPDVDNREWHPFTCVINSATGNGFILIKNYGDWSSKFTQVPASFIYMRTPAIKMSVEIAAKHKRVLIVTSGTFITTVAGTVARAVSLGESHETTQEITIVWIDREPIMIALVCLRLLAEFSMTNFRIYCTAKSREIAGHINEIQIMSTMSANIASDPNNKDTTSIVDGESVASTGSEHVHNVLKRTQTHCMGKDAPKDVIEMLENLTEEFEHIDVFGGRPDVKGLFDEVDPDFCFIGAAPPVAAGVIKEAEKRKVEYATSSYL